MRYLTDHEDNKEKLEIQNKQLLCLYNKLGTYSVCSDIAKIVVVRLYDSAFEDGPKQKLTLPAPLNKCVKKNIYGLVKRMLHVRTHT